MTYLIAASIRTDTTAIRDQAPELWRLVRRYNLPVQLALAAAEDIAVHAADVSKAVVVSLAPCCTGSPDLFRWTDTISERLQDGGPIDARMNPTQTLHVVDNLAMSAFAIAHRNHAYCLGLGGAAGQAWEAVDALIDRLSRNLESEGFLIAGDQSDVRRAPAGLGVALLFSVSPRPLAGTACQVRFVGIQRTPIADREKVTPHAAAGLAGLLEMISTSGPGNVDYCVPLPDTDGIDAVRITMEVSRCATAGA